MKANSAWGSEVPDKLRNEGDSCSSATKDKEPRSNRISMHLKSSFVPRFSGGTSGIESDVSG